MAKLERMEAVIDNPRGRAPVLLVCDHAANHVPDSLAGLGLSQAQLSHHTAWDIGAHALARQLSAALDAPLIAAPASRLIVDPNRDPAAHDFIPVTAEGEPVPGNRNLTQAERAARAEAFHAPFHQAIDRFVVEQPALVALVSVHSFTPILMGAARPWHAGILHGPDARIADVMIDVLAREAGLSIGRNQPYAPEQGVFYTLNRHGAGRATAMIEVRNDLIRDEIGQARWGQRLAKAIWAALSALNGDADKFGSVGRRS